MLHIPCIAPFRALATCLALFLGIDTAAAVWPERPVRLITLAGVGGGSDAAARVLADGLSHEWGRPVVVDNRPGADGIIAVDAFLAAHDRHSLLFTNTGSFSVNPLLHEKLSYVPERDLQPLSFIVEDFIAIVSGPSLPARSLADVVVAARAKPGALNYATVPGLPYLAFLALQKAAAVELTYVAYRNPIGAVPDLVQGRIHLAVMPLATVLGQAETGQVKLLAVMNPHRAPASPATPSLPEAGFAEVSFAGGLGLYGPADMEAGPRQRGLDGVRTVLAVPGVGERLAKLGYLPHGSSPEEFRALLDAQRDRAAGIVRAYGVGPLP
jgi:tripartite-type tricarboxylate transporter receptor subunit TctC